MLKFETVLANSVYYEDENLLFITMKSEPEPTIEFVKKNFEQTYAVLGEKVVRVVMDSRPLEFTHIPKEVLDYVGNSPYNKYQHSSAIVISGIGQKMIANFYLKVVKPAVPTKMFNSIEAALEWQGVQNKKLFG